MWRKVHSNGLICVAIWLLALSVLYPQTKAALASQDPPPETWPDRRGDGWFEDLAHLPPGETSPGPSPARAVSAIPAWSRMVFQSARDGNWEIYLDDGSSQVRLTANSTSDIYPRLNRGCTRIAFASKQSGSYEIYTMNLDGSGVTRLTNNGQDDVSPSWSPDGARIAFTSYRKGQGDIYVMNADGSNQTRLTSDPAWEGEPVWSPDGSQIAFTSYRNSVYRIWRMDADGNNQVQLSDQPNSEHPAWSVTGQIAYDADGDGDSWQELWTMNPDGSGQSQRYDPPRDAWANTDASFASWSPDGRSLVFSCIEWIQYGGNWYWTGSYLEVWDSVSGGVVRLSDQGEDMFPDWQATDLAPPASSLSPLPYRSPNQFTVSWSGWDDGPAGLASFDIQVRDGAGGPWTDWLAGTTESSSAYEGAAGHTYYFRSRARDNAGNLEAYPPDAEILTTVEALAPTTAVETLAAFSPVDITVRWGGSDPGGSGIAIYDVQLRDGAGGWTDWQVGTSETEAAFSGEPGHSYSFRSRGTDRAGNVEPWPKGDGDTSTTFYRWRMTGTLRDNRETPLKGGTVSLEPAALAVLPSDVDGAYAAYEATSSEVYSATWEKAGYGDLPPTAFDGNRDAQANMVLPPAVNAVLNWGFESGSLEPEWLTGGEILPTITSDLAHTGRFSAALAPAGAFFEPWVNLSNSPGGSRSPVVVIDDSGAAHVIWMEYDGSYHVLYTWREPGGSWSAPVDVSGSQATPSLDTPQLAVQADGTVHVAFQGVEPGPYRKIFYNRRSPEGTWSGTINVSQHCGDSEHPDMALGVDGDVHLVWTDIYCGLLYARRSPDGAWSTVTDLSQDADWSEPRLAAGLDGTVHVIWSGRIGGGDADILYVRRDNDGGWSAPLNVSNNPGGSVNAVLAAAADGSLHIAWQEEIYGDPVRILYARRSAGGTWSDPLLVADGEDPQLALGPDGSAHLAWGWGGNVLYAHRGVDGLWSDPEVAGSGERPNLRVDSSGAAHLGWRGYLGQNYEVLYARRTADGVWSGSINLSNTPTDLSEALHLALDGHDGAHVVWQEGNYEWPDIAYSEPARAVQSGESILSQELTVPAEALAPTLSFWYRLDGTGTSEGAWLGARLDDGVSSTAAFTATKSRGWTHAWVDLSPWAGQSVWLRFLLHQTEGQPAAWATLDEVSVGPAYPDLWVDKAVSAPAIPPGEPVEFTLTYGNRGGAAASQVVLTDTLPAGLPFISADPPPTTLTPFLTWAVGDLAAGSGPATITLVAGPAPETGTLTSAVEVATASAELETLNNQAQAQIRIGWEITLPAIMREY